MIARCVISWKFFSYADFIFFLRQLVENSVAPKHQRLSAQELEAIIQLLITKDADLKKTIKVANLKTTRVANMLTTKVANL